MTRSTKLATVTTAALLALALSACSGDSDTPEGSSSSSGTASSPSSETTDAATEDRSAEVFDSYEEAKVVGSTSGKVNLGVGGTDPQVGGEEVTFEVTGVTASEGATTLHYQLLADEEVAFRVRGEFWSQQPSLRVPGSDVRMQSVTAKLPELDGEKSDVCACTAVYSALTEPQPQEVVYPPLPEDVQEVEVILQELDPVTVPVSR
ncbi:hypothetical protein O9K63_12185 [Janibacter cremeus]|uniref:hypothetical protein n=1 Tax=Janibacter cremeus TaxID=1285192 RepID=UPI0023F82CE0|nr:hypothetical protein [Janibacter cremeus]WEV77345.1 hypothetical protein O9K63_12185 [Janibacter cremeus]